MEKEAKAENAGSALARLRWGKATVEERREQGRKMQAGRRKARRRAKKGAAK